MAVPIADRIETIIALLECNEPGVKPALKELYALRLQYRYAKGPLGDIYATINKAVKENWWHTKRKCRLTDFWKDGPPFDAVRAELQELEHSRPMNRGEWDIEEMADVLIILFDMANRWEWTTQQLANAMQAKMELRLDAKKGSKACTKRK